MCNAHNHSWACDCGFGGDTGGGVGVRRSSRWSFASDSRALTHGTPCWWCGKSVFFYRDENGGCALFDALGAPWAVHSCWEEHRQARRSAIDHVERYLQSVGFTGDLDPNDYESLPLPQRSHVITPFWGVVVTNRGWCVPTLGDTTEQHAEWVDLPIEHNGTLYPLHALRSMAEDIPVGVPLKVHARWVYHEHGMVLLATELERHDLRGKRIFRRRIPALMKNELTCEYCGWQISAGEDWRLTVQHQVECARCAAARGNRSVAAFIRHCRLIASRHSNR